jgi:hypothetical protein
LTCPRPHWLLQTAAPLGILLAAAALAAGTAAPASPRIVPYQSPDKDEDPFALYGPDGTAYVFWFSNRMRDGALHSVIAYTTYKDGKFGQFHDISGDLAGDDRDVYPGAVLDTKGVIHVSWFRFHAGSIAGTQFPVSSIMYRTIDAKTGSLGPVESVTGTTDSDWVPSIALDRGNPVIAWASPTRAAKNDVWILLSSRRGARGWSKPAPIKAANAANTQNNLPALANVDGELTLAWNRHPPTGSLLAWEHLDAEVWLSRYRRGAWGRAFRVAPNPSKQKPNVFPSFFQDHARRWHLYWQHHAGGRDSLQAVPANAVKSTVSKLPVKLAGYSPRITRLSTAGQYLALWVHKGATETDLDIAYQQFGWKR